MTDESELYTMRTLVVIERWLQEEKRFCQEKYDEIYGRYAIGQEEKAAANWFSGRIVTCGRLLKLISPKEVDK